MAAHEGQGDGQRHRGCCGCEGCGSAAASGFTRRDFLRAGVALGGVAMTGLTWSRLAAAEGAAGAEPEAPPRKELVVLPILTYAIPRRRNQTSWRSWGGIQTEQHAEEEVKRIGGELKKLAGNADFPVRFLDVARARNGNDVKKALDAAKDADACIIYAAGGGSGMFNMVVQTGKDVIFFCRHKSGPVYLWYEILSPRYLHQHTDKLAMEGVDNQDVVVDRPGEIAWRLRALCGLRNTQGTRILAIGGPSGWGPSGRNAPDLSRDKLAFDIRTVTYKDLAQLIQAAMKDPKVMQAAGDRAAAYLDDKSVTLETKREFVVNAFVLDSIFRRLMAQAQARAITVNACMGTIMPMSKTTACLTLSTLNDAGYLAFCESDFVVIPSGVLLANISGRPHFLNDPTYPHDGMITLAHCTAPRRMNGKDLEPARIVTHFESDYGAAPKVEMRKGQPVTNIIPDFAAAKWIGLSGKIVDAPFLDICRSQIDVAYPVPDEKVALNMPGFHWETIYGDYLREVGYALKKTAIGWQVLG
jgi:hypothetical protein